LRVVVLVENSVGRTLPIFGEHGFSLWIEYEGRKVLFDTGQRGAVVSNAALLDVDLKAVDALVLSHGHSDHTGGLRAALEFIGRKVPVYAHPDLFISHRVSSPQDRYVGVPFVLEELEASGAQFIWVRESRELFPGFWLSGEVPRRMPFEQGDPRMYFFRNGDRVQDPVRDDLSIFVKTKRGLVVLLGCAHAGVVNIVEYARQVTSTEKVAAVIGGTHLGPATPAQLEATIDYLKGLDLTLLAANHCTGLPVAAKLANIFGDRFRFAPAGEVFGF